MDSNENEICEITVVELKIKCPSDILTEYINNKTKIFFEFKPGHNKYTLIKKTKEFELEENNIFNKELIHFFNIDKSNGIIYIYLEIEGKKIKSENNKINYYKLILNDINKEKKEIICMILENIELKILIRIINKKEKIKNKEIIQEDNNYKIRRVYTQYNGYNNNFNKPGLSIKERIKIFEGEFNKNKIYKNENIPGKLKIPEIFLESNKKRSASKDDKEKKNKKENE
jgi:hypothetical protein